MATSEHGNIEMGIHRHTAVGFLLVLLSLLIGYRPTAGQQHRTLSQQLVGGEFSYTAKRGDSLTAIGARFAVDAAVIAADNNLSASSPLKLGQPLRINNRHIIPKRVEDGIVINIPQRMLFYFKEGRLLHFFPVGLGRRDWPTPTGQFKIVVKEENPTWDVPESIQKEMQRAGKTVKTCVPPGPDNPLGSHWLGLSMPGYGIHGTIAPTSIYRFQTHGCIRAQADDIAQLFADVSRGTPAILIYERLLIAKSGQQVYLEAHRDIYNKDPDGPRRIEELLQPFTLESDFDRKLAGSIIRKEDGIARQITRGTGAMNSQ
jgi:L,D-transpeptidase ErfK/SrfK